MMNAPPCPHRTPGRRPDELVARLLADRRGATAIEYGLILALMTLAMLVTFTSVANQTTSMWRKVSTNVEQAR